VAVINYKFYPKKYRKILIIFIDEKINELLVAIAL